MKSIFVFSLATAVNSLSFENKFEEKLKYSPFENPLIGRSDLSSKQSIAPSLIIIAPENFFEPFLKIISFASKSISTQFLRIISVSDFVKCLKKESLLFRINFIPSKFLWRMLYLNRLQ